MRIDTIIADRDDFTTAGISDFVERESALRVIAQAWDSGMVVNTIDEHGADYLICGLSLAPQDGPELITTLQSRFGADAPKVLLLAPHISNEQLVVAISAGAAGVVSRAHMRTELSAALQSAERDELYLSSCYTTQMLHHFVLFPEERGALALPVDPRLKQLTERELSILTLIGAGKSTNEIAKELYLSSATIKAYTSQVFQKIGVRDRLQAAILAFRCGVVTR
jgi:DNA-binding NarL/FixJ family response regulator